MLNELLLNTNGRTNDQILQQSNDAWRMRVLGHFLKAIRDVAVTNPDVRVAPACILWADRDRQGTAAVPDLRAELPELMILDDYTPEKHIGLAIRLRCVKQLIGWNPESMTTT